MHDINKLPKACINKLPLLLHDRAFSHSNAAIDSGTLGRLHLSLWLLHASHLPTGCGLHGHGLLCSLSC
jgi:hypothetical protein